ncbi:MAG: hypothetical protein IJ486_01955 [Firmicutes bacterium]|nr:hypothetical protein [Bacillota bacterium]
MKDELNMMNYTEEDQEILQLLEMMKELPEAPVPDEFDLRLRRALKEENAKRRAETVKTKKTVWKKWTAAAACLMIGFLSFQMIQGGVGTEMMEGGAEAAEIGENSGPVAVMDGEIKKSGPQQLVNDTADADGDGFNLVQDDPVLLSELDNSEEPGLYGRSVESRLAAGIGIDGEVIQISRGQLGSEEREVFAEDCDQVLQWITEGIVEADAGKLADAVMYKNSLEFSEEQAEQALKLYADLFEETEGLHWKCISLTGWSRSNIYRLTDGNRDLMVIISDTPDGLKITEPVLEKAQWLYEQIGEQDFTLMDVICQPEGEEIEFLVDPDDRHDEIRSFVWKETESL